MMMTRRWTGGRKRAVLALAVGGGLLGLAACTSIGPNGGDVATGAPPVQCTPDNGAFPGHVNNECIQRLRAAMPTATATRTPVVPCGGPASQPAPTASAPVTGCRQPASPTPTPHITCGGPTSAPTQSTTGPIAGCRAPSLATPMPTPPTPPVATTPERVYPIQACSLLLRADAEQALRALGSQGSVTAAPNNDSSPHAPRSTCTFRADDGVVSLTINHGVTREQFEQEIRRLGSAPGQMAMGAPVLLGVGRTYNAFYVFPQQRPMDGALYVLFNGGYLEITAKGPAGAQSLSTILPVVDRLAMRALSNGRLLP